jgi:hypothetical protein
MTEQEWLRDYALLALRVNERMTDGTAAGTVLIYRGPREWSAQVENEEPPPAGRLADDAEALLGEVPFEPARARYLTAQVRALRAVARRLAGEELPLPEYAGECLGISARWLPEVAFVDGVVALRDSKDVGDPDAQVLIISEDDYQAFTGGIQQGQQSLLLP